MLPIENRRSLGFSATLFYPTEPPAISLLVPTATNVVIIPPLADAILWQRAPIHDSAHHAKTEALACVEVIDPVAQVETPLLVGFIADEREVVQLLQ